MWRVTGTDLQKSKLPVSLFLSLLACDNTNGHFWHSILGFMKFVGAMPVSAILSIVTTLDKTILHSLQMIISCNFLLMSSLIDSGSPIHIVTLLHPLPLVLCCKT